MGGLYATACAPLEDDFGTATFGAAFRCFEVKDGWVKKGGVIERDILRASTARIRWPLVC